MTRDWRMDEAIAASRRGLIWFPGTEGHTHRNAVFISSQLQVTAVLVRFVRGGGPDAAARR